MHRGYLRVAVLLGALGVGLGAFASHILKDMLSEKSIAIFETGVRYQFYHVFALILSAILYKEYPSSKLIWSCRLFLSGIFIFSGSLYLLAFLLPDFSFIGAITPIGGTCFILGWLMLFFGLLKQGLK